MEGRRPRRRWTAGTSSWSSSSSSPCSLTTLLLVLVLAHLDGTAAAGSSTPSFVPAGGRPRTLSAFGSRGRVETTLLTKTKTTTNAATAAAADADALRSGERMWRSRHRCEAGSTRTMRTLFPLPAGTFPRLHRHRRLGRVGATAAGDTTAHDYEQEGWSNHRQEEGREEQEKLPLTLLLIDNHDSYTYNLYQYLSETCDRVVVVTNDVCDSWDGVMRHLAEHHGVVDGVDGIVISPGPGRPDVDADVGVCKDAVLSNPDLPILGVCLGHQLLAHLAGVEVTLARVGPMHGRISPVRRRRPSLGNDEEEVREALAALFGDESERGPDGGGGGVFFAAPAAPPPVPGEFDVTRYHSLSVRPPSPGGTSEDHGGGDDDAVAASGGGGREGAGVGVIPLAHGVDDDEMMALVVKGRPRHVGVQFHPESIGTRPWGKEMLRHWCTYCARVKGEEEGREREGMRMRKEKKDAAAGRWGVAGGEMAVAAVGGDDDDGASFDRSPVPQAAGGLVVKGDGAATGSVVAPTRRDDDRNGRTVADSPASPAAGSGRYRILVHRVSGEDLGGDDDGDGDAMVVDPEAVFTALYSREGLGFWLDSSNAAPPRKDRGGAGGGDATVTGRPGPDPNSRFSVMGTDDGLFSHLVEYHRGGADAAPRGEVRVRRRRTPDRHRARNRRWRHAQQHGRIADGGEEGHGGIGGDSSMAVEVHRGVDIFTYLKRELFGVGVGDVGGCGEVVGEGNGDNVRAPGVVKTASAAASVTSSYELLDRECVLGGMADVTSVTVREREWAQTEGADDHGAKGGPPSVPFGYRGGYVGYLGYEARHDARRHLLRMENFPSSSGDRRDDAGDGAPPSGEHDEFDGDCGDGDAAASDETVPDAAFLFADRSLVFDHFTGDVYLIGYALRGDVDESDPKDDAGAAEADDSVRSVLEWMRFVVGTLTDLRRQVGVPSEFNRRDMNAKAAAHPGSNISPLGDAGSEESRLMDDRALLANVQSSRKRFRHSSFVPRRPKRVYESDIARCHEEIRNGESYELCLTNQFQLDTAVAEAQRLLEEVERLDPSGKKETSLKGAEEDVPFVEPYDAYRQLRRSNSAPFAAFLNFDHRGLLRRRRKVNSERIRVTRQKGIWHHPHHGVNGAASRTGENAHPAAEVAAAASVAICCSSPERFLSLSPHGVLESKPIKGTSPRGSTPEIDNLLSSQLKSCRKNQAENLMIVDLVRNDFGRLCDVGTVEVPKFCDVESYATVHQLVSTIRGRLFSSSSSSSSSSSDHSHPEFVVPSDKTAVDAIVSCFPGGSMTGAPKLRSMEILHELEGRLPRGPYAGCIGYISPNNAMDMNIVIRTAVMSPSPLSSHETPEGGEVGTRGGTKILVGAGGAITSLSDAEDEYQEMRLKSNAVIDAVLTVLNNEKDTNNVDDVREEDDGAVIPPAEGEQLRAKKRVS